MNRPIVIGHRGASGYRPELTAGALRLAFRMGADSVEIDVLPTKDGDLVCRHDLELSRTTDVTGRPEFAQLRRTAPSQHSWPAGEPATGWFTHDFTIAQLRTLRARERWQKKRALSASYDDKYRLLSLADAVDVVAGESARQGRRLRLHVEIKHPEFAESVGHCLPDILDDYFRQDGTRGVRLTWLSFDPTVLRRLSLRGHHDIVQLFDGKPGTKDLAMVADYAHGVAVRRSVVLPRDRRGRVAEPSRFTAKAHARGLAVNVWSHRAENKHLPSNLQVGSHPHGHGLARREAEMLFDAGCDALITDFPDLGVVALASRARRARTDSPVRRHAAKRLIVGSG